MGLPKKYREIYLAAIFEMGSLSNPLNMAVAAVCDGFIG
jgi:hypothetical protein